MMARSGSAAALCVAALSACGVLDDDQTLPDIARVEVVGTSPVDLELIVSDDFRRVDDLDQGRRYVELVQSDTVLFRPDFTREYDIRVTRRFFVRITNHADEVAQITLAVSFDGESSYRQSATMAEGGSLEFSEVFFGT